MDGQIKQGKIARPPLALMVEAYRAHLPGFEKWLMPAKRHLFYGMIGCVERQRP